MNAMIEKQDAGLGKLQASLMVCGSKRALLHTFVESASGEPRALFSGWRGLPRKPLSVWRREQTREQTNAIALSSPDRTEHSSWKLARRTLALVLAQVAQSFKS
jgi:hypothetical protein